MGKVACAILLLACAAPLEAGEAPSMPSWIAPYPGAPERSGSMTGWTWSRYLATASLDEILAHYRGLFDGAGLPFHPVASSLTTTVRGAPPECSLEIIVQKMLNGKTSVEVSCRSWTTGSKQLQNQAQFDRPVNPKPHAPLPPLSWPAWLTTCDPGVSPEVESGVNQFKLKYLRAEFTSQQDREAIQAFYTALLNAHDYPVWMHSSALYPRDKPAVVEGIHYIGEKPGPRFVVRVQLTPVNGASQVELRITAHPQ